MTLVGLYENKRRLFSNSGSWSRFFAHMPYGVHCDVTKPFAGPPECTRVSDRRLLVRES
jgi:hypothetical protein